MSEQTNTIKTQTNNAAAGAAWLLRGFDYFKRDWSAWLGVTVIYLLIMIALTFAPLGDLIFSVLAPVFVAGLMLGCKAQDEGEAFSIAHLFAGFSHRLGRLALLGLLYVVFALLAGVVMVLAALVLFADFEFFNNLAAGDFDVIGDGRNILLAILIGLAAYIPALMALWFAPVLIVLADQPLLAALKLSFKGCLMNVIPLLVYGLVGLVLGLIASLPLLLGWLILAPMFTASIYLAYKDIFILAAAA